MATFTVEYTVDLWREGKQIVARAMPLDVVSCGETVEKAEAAIDEAVGLFLETAVERGSVEDLLVEAGYELNGDVWAGPARISVERRSTAIAV